MAEGTQRRLTTIVAADIAGFSRLISIDEEGTLSAQRGHRTALIEPLLSEYHGRIANTAGDSFLLEFPSAVEAVRCSIAVQEGIAERNSDIPADRRIEYRIGVNVGDVVADGDDLLGDGVNIAARLENLCEPGGVVLSDSAYQQVRDRLDFEWQDGGEHEVKNITRPVQVWRWGTGTGEISEQIVDDPEPLALPDKPSIAVLPFQNMSGDTDEEFFADGMAEDIITALSRHRSLFVIARNSTFAYKGQSPDLRKVSAELGVRYVLEGSVRKGGNRVRITAQLIEGATGNHIWAERYDRTLDDIFAVQDEMTQEITARIGPEIDQAERDRARTMPPENLDAWESYQRGLWHLYHFTTEDNAEAQRLFRRAIEASNTFAPAHAGLTHALYYAYMHGYAEDRQVTLDEAYASGRAAVTADERDADTHFALGRILYLRQELASSLKEFETAVAQNPNFAHAHLGLGTALLFDGQWERCMEASDQAARLSPHDPVMWTILVVKAMGLIGLERYPEAEEVANEAVRQPTAPWTAHAISASASGLAGNRAAGAAALADVRHLKHDFNIDDVRRVLPFREPSHLDPMIEGLRLVGVED
jgi:adenylate cyclase